MGPRIRLAWDTVIAAIWVSAPSRVAVDGNGNVYIVDTFAHRIRKIEATTGIISTIAGTGLSGFAGDGDAAAFARLYFPTDLAVDTAGNVYIADANNNRIRRVDSATGVIATFAGTGVDADLGDGGPATSAQFSYPSRIAVDAQGNLYVSNGGRSFRIRKIDAATGIVTSFAGNGYQGDGGDGGLATVAQFGNGVLSMAVDRGGKL